MKALGKKAFLHKILSTITNFLSPKKTVVFDALNSFHFSHVEHVIRELNNKYQHKINIIISCPDNLDIGLAGVKAIKSCDDLFI